jgi:NAD(P)H dehydrogenase (quinone)
VRVLLLNSHPDAGSLCDAIAGAYAKGACDGGHEVRCVALRELRFDLVLRGGYHSAKPLESDIMEQQELIWWCEHLVVVTPNGGGAPPPCLRDTLTVYFCLILRCDTVPGSRMSNRY